MLERVGRGTFGRVYRAWDTRLDREVALKLLPAGPAASDARATSIIEEVVCWLAFAIPTWSASTAPSASANISDSGWSSCDGHTLEQLLEQGRVFDQKEAVAIGIQLCQAVAAVHQAGLLHRDIKAHNVMLTNENRVVLMDFGTGRALGDGPAARDCRNPPVSRSRSACGRRDHRRKRYLRYRRAALPPPDRLLSCAGEQPRRSSECARARRSSRLLLPRARISRRSWSASSSARSIRSLRVVHTVRRRLRADLESLRRRSKLIPLASRGDCCRNARAGVFGLRQIFAAGRASSGYLRRPSPASRRRVPPNNRLLRSCR